MDGGGLPLTGEGLVLRERPHGAHCHHFQAEGSHRQGHGIRVDGGVVLDVLPESAMPLRVGLTDPQIMVFVFERGEATD